MSRRSASLAPRAIAAPSFPLVGFVALFFSLVLLTFVAGARASTIDVPGDYPTIQAAIDAATEGDSVLVAPGTYLEANVQFKGKRIVVASAEGPEVTTVDACFANWAFWFGAGETRESILDGFTITGGNGGIVIDGDYDAAPTVRNCVVSGNRGYTGGGLVIRHGASPLIENCTIAANTADYGGGIYVSYESSPTIRGCEISRNFATGEGGGVKAYYSAATLENCTISENSGGYNGGGLCAEGYYPVTLSSSIIEANSAIDGAGAFARGNDLFLANCVVVNNTGWIGAGLWAVDQTNMVVQNCVIAQNWNSGLYGGGVLSHTSAVEVVNSVAWGNAPDQLVAAYDGVISATYSDVQGGYTGQGNIDADPLFRSVRGFDYVLAPGSPCVDAGDPTIEDGVYDTHPRWPQWYPNGSRSDMGAYGGPENKKWLAR